MSISEKVGKKYVFVPNPLVPRIRKIQIELCQTYNLYVYDLYACMGGAGSMQEWSKLGLTDSQHIHLSMKGYTLAGESMSKAFAHHLMHIQKHD